MRWATCFFVVRAEYQGGILHAAGDNAPRPPCGGGGSDQLPR